jgi:hypothetical protein
MVNLAGFHLLMTPATIALDIGKMGLLIPLTLSFLVIAYTWWRSRQPDDPFVTFHWQLAMRRARYLLISYAVAAGLIALGGLITLSSSDRNMAEIIQTIFLRIGIVPILLTVIVLFYLESNAINLANNGQMQEEKE